MNTFIFFLLGFSYLCLLIWGLVLTKKLGLLKLSNVLLLVILGLVFDNLIIAFGKFVGEGNVLKGLSNARFWIHALFTPTLILFAWRICFEIGVPWARKTFWKGLAYFFTLGLIMYELVAVVRELELEPKWEKGVLTYENVSQSDSPVMVIFITLILGIVGFILMKKFHFIWLFTGTVVIASGSFLTIWIKSFPIMNVLEFVFIVTLLMTKQFQMSHPKSNKS